MKGNFIVKKKVANLGFYCDIEILIEFTKENSCKIENINLFPQWKHTLEFSFQYFLEHYQLPLNSYNGLTVEIVKLNTMVADSKVIIVAYTFIMALCNATSFKIEDLEFSEGKFIFPK